jgi:hypothetical protein
MSPAAFCALLWGEPDAIFELTAYSGERIQLWIPCRSQARLRRALHIPDCYVSGVARREENTYALTRAHMLWVRLERGECGARLARFQPAPTLVIREGATARRWAYWALSDPLHGFAVDEANQRLAWAWRGRRAVAAATTLVLSPFTRLQHGDPFCEFESTTISTPGQIVGRLPDPPPADAWRERVQKTAA